MKAFWRPNRDHPQLPQLRRASVDHIPNFLMPVFWAVSDREKVLAAIEAAVKHCGAGVHFADNLFTWGRNNSMLDDHEFVKSWQTNAETNEDKAIVWRRYILACAAHH